MQTTRHKDAVSLIKACRTDHALRQEITEKVAEQFIQVARDDIEERDLVGIDYANTYHGSKDVCATHDYVDANMTMDDAINRVVYVEVEDVKAAPTIDDLVMGEGHEAEAARGIWNDAWDIAKKRGFSPLWGRRSEVEDVDFKALASVVLQRPEGRFDDERFPHLPFWVDIEDDIVVASSDFLDDLDAVADLQATAKAVSEALKAEDENMLLEAIAGAVPEPAP